MRALALIATLIASSPAWADWQYTKWGMTPDEVASAAGSAALRGEWPDQSTARARALVSTFYRTSDQVFSVMFLFSRTTGGLEEVALQPKDANACASLRAQLNATYGQSVRPGGGDPNAPRQASEIVRTDRWFDRASGNQVTLVDIGHAPTDLCEIDYNRLAVPGESGGL